MAAHRGRRKAHHHEEGEHENDERWLLTYADMITLLLALFMVLYAISSVNTTKLESLSRSLQEAFSGKVLPGGSATIESGASEKTEQPSPEPPLPALTPVQAVNGEQASRDAGDQAKAAAAEQEDFERLKRRVDALVKRDGLEGRVVTEVRRRGLVVQLLTDGVFFDSGRAELKPQARAVLGHVGGVVAGEREHPVVVEGYTDSQPVGGQDPYPTNWELSGARAASVVRAMGSSGVATHRLSLTGYAQQHPISSNATPAGRSRNRRVEVVLARMHSPTAGTGSRP
jgi:chemotaxis protein MotB